VIVRLMTLADWEQVASVYRQGIATGNATFETDVPAWEEWDAGHLDAPRLVADGEGDVLGWVALSPVSDRCVYSGAVRSWASRPYILSTGRVTAPLPRQRSSMIWVGPHSSPGR